jgi:hypothetical protein
MTLKRAIVRVELVSAFVESNGDPPEDIITIAEEKNNAIVATLKYPRSGAPSVVSSFPVNLKSGVEISFTGDFFERGLFKEEVQGETELELVITDRDEPNKLDQLLGQLFSVLMGFALGGVPSFIGAIGKVGVKAATDSLSETSEHTVVIAKSTRRVLLKVGEIPTRIEVDLKAPVTIKKKVRVFNEETPPKVVLKEMTLVKKGDKGKVVLELSEHLLD